MNPAIKVALIKTSKSIIAFIAIMMIAISSEMAKHPEQKYYPVLLFLSVVYLQWVSWDLFFELIGVPMRDEGRIRLQFSALFKKLLLDRLILLGYCAIISSSFIWYMPVEHGMPVEVIKYGIILIVIGVLARMFAVIRMLIAEKYRNENH